MQVSGNGFLDQSLRLTVPVDHEASFFSSLGLSFVVFSGENFFITLLRFSPPKFVVVLKLLIVSSPQDPLTFDFAQDKRTVDNGLEPDRQVLRGHLKLLECAG